MHTISLTSPLDAVWTEQDVRLALPGLRPGTPLSLRVDGAAAPFQYTGVADDAGAQVLVRLGLARGQKRTLEFAPAPSLAPGVSLTRHDIVVPEAGVEIGVEGRKLKIQRPRVEAGRITGPFAGYAGRPLDSSITCSAELLTFALARVNDGPLFVEYELEYRFTDAKRYLLRLRCSRHEPIIDVHETIALGMDAKLTLAFNPAGTFDRVLSHGNFEFEGDRQPTDEALRDARPRDLLLRIQAPVLGEYVVPNNRGWFALYSTAEEGAGGAAMLGLMTIDPGRWTRAAENIMHLHVRGGRAELSAPLGGGERRWALLAAPLEKGYTPERRFVFNRLHAELNALRLDEHLDLADEVVLDASCAEAPGVLGENYRQRAHAAAASLPPLRRFLAENDAKALDNTVSLPLFAALEPTSERLAALKAMLFERFERWVWQFQGHRKNQGDYAKNVIGFTRRLRGLMIAYELLRKERALTDAEVRRFGSYFVFAARRIMDAGRWPHERTWLHPDHPESTRDFYTYPGEHRPDKLVWTNCLPNFQSDPLTALVHLAALVPDHPDSKAWLRFGLDDLDRQLDAYCGPTGAWEESINYAAYTLSYFVITFRILKNRLGIDYFNDPRMRRYVTWLVRFLAPLDKRWGVHTWPAIGNSGLPTGGGEYLLAYASELAQGDPLRDQLIAAYQRLEPTVSLMEHYPLITAIGSVIPDPARGLYPLPACVSERMDEVGVAMRHDHDSPRESFLFQKIGFAKDHYEGDESAFNWYAKGTPLAMDYGTYTPDVALASAHNLVEIPDADYLRRGYLGETFFSPALDYTRSEVPVTLKLQHGKVRTFAEIDGPPQKPLYFYMGDENPVGPKTWVTRMLLFVKPDYLLILDRVFGATPHRFNLHSVTDKIVRDGSTIRATGRFNLDLLCFVQHPDRFDMQTGELTPKFRTPEQAAPHRQSFFRIYNTTDALYRTVLFAQERERKVEITRVGKTGVRVSTPEYVDYAFVSDEVATERLADVAFVGRAGWIRRWACGKIEAAMPDGDLIGAFGTRIEGRGPWAYNAEGKGAMEIRGTPRAVKVSKVEGV
ncbi:MAG: hypothetical protein NTW19_05520 [Planctomycetota bacterium]|nr:hypothetical protein [Planctomycetota bacterium]